MLTHWATLAQESKLSINEIKIKMFSGLAGHQKIKMLQAWLDTKSYCATLAHKANHSFTPNCQWKDFFHPRWAKNHQKFKSEAKWEGLLDLASPTNNPAQVWTAALCSSHKTHFRGRGGETNFNKKYSWNNFLQKIISDLIRVNFSSDQDLCYF